MSGLWSRVVAYLQLVRLPAVFTAMADVLMGFFFVAPKVPGEILSASPTLEQPGLALGLLLTASVLLYTSGMALNDYFDRQEDARQRPNRPIPSGRISPAAARRLGFALLGAGCVVGWGAAGVIGSLEPGLVALAVAGAVLLYDGLLKATVLGPAVMGSARALNVLLGMSAAGAAAWGEAHLAAAGGLGLYVAGVTLFARREDQRSPLGPLVGGMLVMGLGIATLALLPQWRPLRVPAPAWQLLMTVLGLTIAVRCLRAIVDPRPQTVQVAVKNALLSLIVFNGAITYAVRPGVEAFLVLALLLPAMLIGRWLYST